MTKMKLKRSRKRMIISMNDSQMDIHEKNKTKQKN